MTPTAEPPPTTSDPTISYGVGSEGRPTTVIASPSTPLVTAASYSALGLTALTLGSNDSDAYSYDSNTGRMNQYRFSRT